MDWIHLRALFFEGLAQHLPWMLGVLVVVSVVTFGPLGRALLRYLREHTRDAALTESVLTELGNLRVALVAVIERLDATEHRLWLAGPRPLDASKAPTTETTGSDTET